MQVMPVRADNRGQTGLTTTVVRGASVTGLGNLVTLVITFASYVVLARLASPEVFGTLAAGWTIVGASSFVVESGMSSALIQRQDRLEEAAATATVATFGAGIGLALLALALAPVVGLFFHSHEVGLVAAALSGMLFMNAATVVPDALLRRRFSFLRRGVVDPIDAFSYGIVGATLLALGLGVWGLVIATYVAGFVRITAVWLFVRWVPNLRLVSFAMWRDLARFGRHIAASELLRQVRGIANTALLGRFLGLAPLGEYRFGWRMATQAAIPVTTAGAYVLFPAFARIADDSERFLAAFLRSLRMVSAFALPISFALAPLGTQIAVAFLGEPWRAAGHVLTNEVYKAANRPHLVAHVSLALTIGMVVGMIAFLPLGVTAVAGAMSLAYLLTGAYALGNVARVFALPLKTLGAELSRPALASAAMAGVLALFAAFIVDVDGEPASVRLGWLAAEACLGILVYGVVLRILAPSTVRELVQAIHSLRGRTAGGRVAAD
jgi:O-antigen/teichoic acid export membrane protein